MKKDLLLPKIYLLQQHFTPSEIKNIQEAVHAEVIKLNLSKKIKPGQSVAITAGSRGIKNFHQILKAVINEIITIGAKPFIVPAMGSHGGGTAEGQKKILTNFGITEESMGCEIRSAMDVVEIGKTDLGIPVYLDKYAAEADHIAVINRIKPHTKLIGAVESGLIKMCLIGLGKREGAKTYHRGIDHYSWMEIVESTIDLLLKKTNICFGLAILQNSYENIGKIIGIEAKNFLKAEPELLIEARDMMAKLPFNDIDLLIVDEMGKDVSGSGMDTNITGRKDDSPMKVVRVFARDLTEATGGNAHGIGLADFTTRRLVNKIDYNALYLNSQTAYRTDTCKIPMTFETDLDVLKMAVNMAGIKHREEYKLVWIRNTLHLEKIIVSEHYINQLKNRTDLTLLKGPFDIEFNNAGNLISPL